MTLGDLSFINEGRVLEVEAVDEGRGVSEFTLAPGSAGFGVNAGASEEESLFWRPVDDVMDVDDRSADLPRYVALAEAAFRQRGLVYPFAVDDSGDSLAIVPGRKQFASAVAALSRIVRHGNPAAAAFEKRGFRALQKFVGGWGACVGTPRQQEGMGAEKSTRRYRQLLLQHEAGTHWPPDFSPNGDNGADGLLILGRGWGGPIVFYQSKNTGFDLEAHPEEFSRIPAIAHDWFGKRVNKGRRVIPVLALNTVLTIEIKERIYEERGELNGAHMIDAVDILAAEHPPADHVTTRSGCLVF